MFSKKLTKKLLALGAAAMLALAAAGCGGSDKADAPKEAANGKLTIAINATFPPFESVKEGTHDYVGVDIDIARYIGQKLGKEVTFTDMKFASLVPTLQSGRAGNQQRQGRPHRHPADQPAGYDRRKGTGPPLQLPYLLPRPLSGSHPRHLRGPGPQG